MTRRSFSALLAGIFLTIGALFGPRRVPVRIVVLSSGKDCPRCKEQRCPAPHHVTLVRTDTGEDIGRDVSIYHNPDLPWAVGQEIELVRFSRPLRVVVTPEGNHVAMRPPLPVVVVA